MFANSSLASSEEFESVTAAVVASTKEEETCSSIATVIVIVMNFCMVSLIALSACYHADELLCIVIVYIIFMNLLCYNNDVNAIPPADQTEDYSQNYFDNQHFLGDAG